MINIQQYWKMILLTSIFILICFLSFPPNIMAKASKKLESLIIQREWDKVTQIANPGKDATLYHQVYRIKNFLNSRDNCIKYLNQACFNRTVNTWKVLLQDLRKKTLFSKEFYLYLNSQKETFRTKFGQTEKELSDALTEDLHQCKKIENALPPTPSSTALKKAFDCYAKVWARSAKRYIHDFGGKSMSNMSPEMFELSKRIKEAEYTEWGLEKKRKEEERIKIKKEAQIKRKKKIEIIRLEEEKEFEIVSNKAAKLGYEKVLKVGVARFLYNVKKQGRLKEGLNVLLWSKSKSIDEKLDKKFMISQILEHNIIYNL